MLDETPMEDNAVKRAFDVAPFRLPNTPPHEVWFEEPRDVEEVVVRFRGEVARHIGVEYRQHGWPRHRFESHASAENPGAVGWNPQDDWFNGAWRPAAIAWQRRGHEARVRFQPLTADGYAGDLAGYAVRFRRTLALRLTGCDPAAIRSISVHTVSPVRRDTLRVVLDAGRPTRGRRVRLEAYNAEVIAIRAGRGVDIRDGAARLRRAAARSFTVAVRSLQPAHRSGGDRAQLTFHLDHESFTVALADLREAGPVWHADEGIFISDAVHAMSFAEYRRRHEGRMTVKDKVASMAEQTFGGAFFGQPRGHAVNFSVGCKYSPQRFRIEPNGDVVLAKRDISVYGRRPELAARFRSPENADVRFFFGFELWIANARFADPAPAPIANLHFRRGNLLVEERAVCAPVEKKMGDRLLFRDPTAALIRFRFRNAGDAALRAELPLALSCRSGRYAAGCADAQEGRVPVSPRDPLTARQGRIVSKFDGRDVLRAVYEGGMQAAPGPNGPVLAAWLKPGAACEAVLKIPFVELDARRELDALSRLDFEQACRDATVFWRREAARGSQIRTPVPHLDAVHAAHIASVAIADTALPENPALVSTSVGTSTYPNFINESCMIIEDLDQRGLKDEARRRLAVFLAGQGRGKQPGNFTDFAGSFFGACGWECGDYNQHHGWALWRLAEHGLLTRDRRWFGRVAGAIVLGADWVFRQRRTTMQPLPHSRGWERGFLPAGSLEDVTDFYYWLSTNVLTWRGTDAAARALEAFGHPAARRVRRESDRYRRDLARGFDLSRRYCPLVKLHDGRWAPHFPSRLYCRGRDYGWIREVLEGAVYLLISGFYAPDSKQADWILNDYLDNLYHTPPYGYVIRDLAANLRNRGGISMQPNLLAGLLPHLDRDEIEVYLWMFFNAWASCYREEIGGMVEHPLPELGFDNAVAVKTSDEANALMWLRYMLVYPTRDALHLGRAIPRRWLRNGEEVRIARARTPHGVVDARWRSAVAQGEIRFEGRLRAARNAPRVLVRFRHPDKAPIKSVTVNGRAWKRWRAAAEEVEITGWKGSIRIVAKFVE